MLNFKNFDLYPQSKTAYQLLEQKGAWQVVGGLYTYVFEDIKNKIFYKKQSHNSCNKSDEEMYITQHLNCLRAYEICQKLNIIAPEQYTGFIHKAPSKNYPGYKDIEIYTTTAKVPGDNLHKFLFQTHHKDLAKLPEIKKEAHKKQFEYNLLLGNTDDNMQNMTVISTEPGKMKFGIFDLDGAFAPLEERSISQLVGQMPRDMDRQELVGIVHKVRHTFKENKELFPAQHLLDSHIMLDTMEKFVRVSPKFDGQKLEI